MNYLNLHPPPSTLPQPPCSQFNPQKENQVSAAGHHRLFGKGVALCQLRGPWLRTEERPPGASPRSPAPYQVLVRDNLPAENACSFSPAALKYSFHQGKKRGLFAHNCLVSSAQRQSQLVHMNLNSFWNTECR